jgi:hypothetical protein
MRALAIILACRCEPPAEPAKSTCSSRLSPQGGDRQLLPPFERPNGHIIRAGYAQSGALIPRFDRGESTSS